MRKAKEAFQKHAQGMLDLVLDATGHDLVYQELCRREAKLKKVAFEVFCAEYVAAKLALGCVSWGTCCREHEITDKDINNLFFREAMNLYQSPRSLEDATRFSESLYASNANTECSPAVGVLARFFHKLGLETVAKPDDNAEAVHTAFCFMMEVSEALKTVFENRFDEFFYSDENLTAERP